MTIVCDFLFNFINFCVIVSFLTRLLILGILFSTAVRVVVVAKLLILSIFDLTSFMLALRVVLLAKLVISSILTSMFLIFTFYYVFFNNINFYYTG